MFPPCAEQHREARRQRPRCGSRPCRSPRPARRLPGAEAEREHEHERRRGGACASDTCTVRRLRVRRRRGWISRSRKSRSCCRRRCAASSRRSARRRRCARSSTASARRCSRCGRASPRSASRASSCPRRTAARASSCSSSRSCPKSSAAAPCRCRSSATRSRRSRSRRAAARRSRRSGCRVSRRARRARACALAESGARWLPEQWSAELANGRVRGSKALVPEARGRGAVRGGLPRRRARAGRGRRGRARRARAHARPRAPARDARARRRRGRAARRGRRARASSTPRCVLLAADAFGAAHQLVRMTVAYVQTRQQFGQPLAPVPGREAPAREHGRSTSTRRAASGGTRRTRSTTRPPRRRARAALAKAHITDRAQQVARDAVEAHGGIGFTWESRRPHLVQARDVRPPLARPPRAAPRAPRADRRMESMNLQFGEKYEKLRAEVARVLREELAAHGSRSATRRARAGDRVAQARARGRLPAPHGAEARTAARASSPT